MNMFRPRRPTPALVVMCVALVTADGPAGGGVPPTKRTRSRVMALLVALAVLLVAAPARASASWLTPTVLSSTTCACGDPAAATDAAGDATVAWRDPQLGLMVARHPAGGTWGSAVAVGPAADPVLAANPAGDAVLAYVSGGDVEAIVTRARESWSATAASPVSTGGAQTAPSVAIDGQGDALVAWETPSNGGFYSIDVAYRPAGGAWEPAVAVDDDAVKNVAPSVAFTSDGSATIVWATTNGSDEAVVSATMADPGSWTSPIQISTDTFFYTVQVVLDGSGAATAAWTGYDGTNYVLGAAERPFGGAWHSDGNLAAGGQSDGPTPIAGFDLAVNAAGRAALVWGVGVDGPTGVAVAVRPAGGGWGATHSLVTTTSPSFIEYPQVVVAPDGTITADWAVDDDGADTGAVWAVGEPPDGTWHTAATISQPIQSDEGGVTLVDPTGDVDVFAVLFSGSGFPVWSIIDDAGGPLLDRLAVPASGTIGVPISFAVTPVDAWSAILVTNWNFGDGTAATDESVSHVYTAPGAYTVVTSSSDVLGHVTSQSSTIVIGPAPVTGSGTPTSPGPKPRTRLTLRVTQAHPRWREATRASAARGTAVDTRFGVTVNQAARVTLTFSEAMDGRRVHGRCRTINATDRHDHRCTRNVPRGKLSLLIDAAGRRSLKFTGRLGGHRLGPGRYTVTVHATGTGSSVTRRLYFTITD